MIKIEVPIAGEKSNVYRSTSPRVAVPTTAVRPVSGGTEASSVRNASSMANAGMSSNDSLCRNYDLHGPLEEVG